MTRTLILALILAAASHGAEVTLQWDYPYTADWVTNVTGFTAHYGTSSRDYTQQVDYPSQPAYSNNSGIVTGLDPEQTYYIALTAYSRWTNHSAYSHELIWDNIAPVVVAPETIDIRLMEGQPAVLPDYLSLVTASDDVDSLEQLTLRQVPAPGSPLTAGMVVAWEAWDRSSNTGRTERTISVTIEATRPVAGVSGTGGGKALLINEDAK